MTDTPGEDWVIFGHSPGTASQDHTIRMRSVPHHEAVMKAVVFDQVGNPATVLRCAEVPIPEPGAGEVRVRMLAASVNPSDVMFIRGIYGLKPNFPATPGFEGVGIVEAGRGALAWFLKGKRVVVMNDRRGNWGERTIAAARQCIPVPGDLTDEQAATFFVNPATALALTKYVLNLQSGAWLLQTAAGSALARMVIRLGKLFGFKTFNVVRRPELIDELKKLGADEVVLENTFEESARKIQPEGFRAVIDPIGGTVGTRAISLLAPGGRAILYGLLSGEPVTIDPRFLITGSKRIEGFWLADWAKQLPLRRKLKLIRQIRGLIRQGILTTDIGEIFPLDQVVDAVTRAESPGRSGKVLLRIGQWK